MKAIFAQAAEDALKLAFFAGQARGTFVEVGANQPRGISQTWELEQRGWSGILIKPQPDLADALRRQRTAKVFAVACSSRQRDGTCMTLHLAGPHSSFDDALNLAAVKPHGTLRVPVRTLDDILDEAGVEAIDFTSIDVEGHELEVLDGFDLRRRRPRLLLVEDLLLHCKLHNYLVAQGYRWIRRTGINNWYVRGDASIRLGLPGRWQLFNKLYLGMPFRRLRSAWRRRVTVPETLAR